MMPRMAAVFSNEVIESSMVSWAEWVPAWASSVERVKGCQVRERSARSCQGVGESFSRDGFWRRFVGLLTSEVETCFVCCADTSFAGEGEAGLGWVELSQAARARNGKKRMRWGAFI